MHVAKVVRPYKDREYVYHFVRQSYREEGKVKHRTLANLSHLPPTVIELVRRALAGDREPHGARIVRVAAGRLERLGRALAELRDVRAVLGALARRLDDARAVLGLGAGVEVVVRQRVEP